jgi:ATP-binding cassette subfamily B protein
MALARALFRGAPFVVMDEPSAALDARAEAQLFDRIRRVAHGRTVLFISHRFSTVRLADRIYVLHDGQVVESGSHDELMEYDGRYAELYRLQVATLTLDA